MKKIDDRLVTAAEKHVSVLLTDQLPETVLFHNLSYVQKLDKQAETIGKHEGLTEEEMNILRIGALFLYSGYTGGGDKVREKSAEIAAEFLVKEGIEPEAVDLISRIILSAGAEAKPEGLIAEALCDADLMFLASENAIEQFDLLFDECVMLRPGQEKRPVYEKRWVDFLTSHQYYTNYGKTKLQDAKEETLRRLSDRMNRRRLIEARKESASEKRFSYSRGVDTMFRITARNQINLNSIADNKSNILISVNAIIISIIITMLAGNIGNMSKDIIPILVLLVVCMVTITIAILSTRPNIVTSKFSGADIQNHQVDLNFFGNFIRMDYDEYLNAVRDMMRDDEYLYSVLLKNQYELGKILSKKFRLVRIAYNVFMIGMIVTVVAFIVNYLFVH